ncbi:MAG: hypothetical protein MJ126_05725 [Lachnospiraceae bacterium]|nr:hypothetical protein [Lachnospiraceae bacterium]
MKFEWEYEQEIDELNKIVSIYEKYIDAFKEKYEKRDFDEDLVCDLGELLIKLDEELKNET